MKKILAILMAAATVTATLAMASCSKQDAEQGGSNTDETAKLKILDTEYVSEDYAICIAKENDEFLADVNEALAAMKEEGITDKIVDKYISGKEHDLVFQADAEGKPELHMATNAQFPPYEYYDGDKIVGIDAEMAAAIADKLDMKLVIDDMEFDAVITAVQTNKADMGMAGMTVTEERKENVNFSDSYATGKQVVIVTGDSKITSVDDLSAEGAEYLIGTQRGTTGDIYCEDDFGADRVNKYSSGSEAVQALLSGKVDCVIIDNEPAKAFVEANNK